MSPNEHQLRAALRDGEGEGIDAGALIAHAVGVRRERRRRVTAIAGATTVVAVVAAGAVALFGTSHTESGGSSSALGVASPKAPMAAHASDHRASNRARSAPGADRVSTTPPASFERPHLVNGAALAYAAGIPCPAQPDHLALPGGGGSGRFGSAGPLFARPVAVFRMCAYPAQSAGPAQATTVPAPIAQQLAAQLDSGSTLRPGVRCEATPDPLGGTIELLPVIAVGKGYGQEQPVTITVSCAPSKVTNGTAVRYLTKLPQLLTDALVPSSGGSASASPPRAQGSPPR